MPVEVLYPYRTAAEMILLYLDIPEQEESLDREQVLPIYLCEDSTITIRASAIVPDQVWQKVFHPSEQSSPPAKLWLVVQSLESRLRKAYEFEGDQHVFELTMALDRDKWAGKAEFQAVLVRSKLNEDLPAGYAGDLGTRLAWSRALWGAFEEPVPPRKTSSKLNGRNLRNLKSLNSLCWSIQRPCQNSGSMPTLKVCTTFSTAEQYGDGILRSQNIRAI